MELMITVRDRIKTNRNKFNLFTNKIDLCNKRIMNKLKNLLIILNNFIHPTINLNNRIHNNRINFNNKFKMMRIHNNRSIKRLTNKLKENKIYSLSNTLLTNKNNNTHKKYLDNKQLIYKITVNNLLLVLLNN